MAVAAIALVGAGFAAVILAVAGRHMPSVADRTLADTIVAAMPRPDRAGQVIMTGIGATSYDSARLVSARVSGILADLKPGAVLLFGYNIPGQASGLSALAAELGSIASSAGAIPPLVAVDHEGGTVFRFRDGVTKIPPAREMGTWPETRIQALAARSGAELRALGVTLVLAPVAEVLDAESAGFLGSRAFGADARTVGRSAAAFVRGMRYAGVAATAKHFPGNGSVDPHRGLPVLSTNERSYRAAVAPAFSAAIRAGAAAVMMSHAVAPNLDPEALPATLSPDLIRRRLKRGLGFSGIVLTDDLYMAALGESGAGNPADAAIDALSAGADMVMLSAAGQALAVRDALADAVASGRLAESRLSDAAARIVAWKIALGLVGSGRGFGVATPLHRRP